MLNLRKEAVYEVAGALFVAAVTLAVHWSALDGWWLWDDAQIVAHAQRFRWYEVLVDREAWRWLSRSNFTPLVTISFEVDLALGGLSPRAFYVHQVSVIVATGVALFTLLRALGTTRPAAVILAIFFVGSPPAVECARALMTRHYLEGALFFLLSANVWVRASRRSSLAIAAGLGLLATLSKELYVPLLLGLVGLDWLRGRRGRDLFERVTAVSAVVAVYSVWRISMLGGLGGYGDGIRGGQFQPSHVLSMLVGTVDPPWWLASLTGAGILVFYLLQRVKLAVAGLGTIAILALLPLFPVLRFPFTRYFLVLVLLSAIVLGMSQRWIGGRWFAFAVSLLAVGSLGAGAELGRAVRFEGHLWAAEGRWMLAGPPQPTLFGKSHTLHLHGLQIIYGEPLRNPVWLSPLIADRPGVRFGQGGRRFPFDPASRRIRLLAESEAGFEFRRADGVFRWSLNPRNKEWFYVASPYGEWFPFKSAGWLRWPTGPWPPTLEGQGTFRFAVQESKHEWSLTPTFRLPAEGEVVRWGKAEE